MFLGLCMLADWIGSDETHFPFCDEPRDDYMQTARHNAHNALLEIGLNIGSQRSTFHVLPALPNFDALFGIPNATPNPIQHSAIAVPLDERLVIIESETGSGKTEAALWRFAHMYQDGRVDGLYFALPTRAAASQMHGRITRFIDKLFPEGVGPEPVLAVPGYVRAGAATGGHLANYTRCGGTIIPMSSPKNVAGQPKAPSATWQPKSPSVRLTKPCWPPSRSSTPICAPPACRAIFW